MAYHRKAIELPQPNCQNVMKSNWNVQCVAYILVKHSILSETEVDMGSVNGDPKSISLTDLSAGAPLCPLENPRSIVAFICELHS